jgi:hypothetical protein
MKVFTDLKTLGLSGILNAVTDGPSLDSSTILRLPTDCRPSTAD